MLIKNTYTFKQNKLNIINTPKIDTATHSAITGYNFPKYF